MGSISRYSAIEDFIKTFDQKLSAEFQKLIGLEVKELKEVNVNYHVKGDVVLSSDEQYPVHFRWSSETEDSEGKEIPEEEDSYTMDEYYKDKIIGKTITSVRLGHADRDDEVYLLAYVGEESEQWHCLEIPIGFDPEHQEISGFAEQFISEEEFEDFLESRGFGKHPMMKKGVTERGFALHEFTDAYGVQCSLQKSSLATADAIWLGVDNVNPQIMASDTPEGGTGWVPYLIPANVHLTNRMHLTREMAKELIDALQVFVDTGNL